MVQIVCRCVQSQSNTSSELNLRNLCRVLGLLASVAFAGLVGLSGLAAPAVATPVPPGGPWYALTEFIGKVE